MFRFRAIAYGLIALIGLALWSMPRLALASDDPHGVPEDEVLASQYYDVSSSDNIIHITNNTVNDLCAQIYVFDNHQQLQECCSCKVTSDGFDALSVTADLLSNPSHGTAPTKGVIEIQSTFPNNGRNCAVNQASGVPYEAIIAPQLDAWISHEFSGFVTEEEFQETDDSEAQEDNLENQCAAAFSSGFGRCSCGSSG